MRYKCATICATNALLNCNKHGKNRIIIDMIDYLRFFNNTSAFD